MKLSCYSITIIDVCPVSGQDRENFCSGQEAALLEERGHLMALHAFLESGEGTPFQEEQVPSG